ncbi:MAG TPA: type II secretion system minor pseudopilin GspI [Woeseiaceae bacterium]|jgi:general secretion pathway protein I|nr:type II secretion system minor pseudopilin GspI [Woeseiaceae bacterium]
MRHRRGFTLIEVVVALAIVGFAMASVAGVMNRMISDAGALRDRTYASWIAQNKIAEIRLSGVMPEVSTTSGELDYGNGRWFWRAVVAETTIENFRRVDVSVSYAESDYVVRTVTGFVGLPVPPGSANAQWRSGPGGDGPEGPTK